MKGLISSSRLTVYATAALIILTLACSDPMIDSDRPRQAISWDIPDGFEPSHITVNNAGARWGLFISRRYSGKDNLWAVRSVDGGEWRDPVLLMKAYLSTSVKFEIEADTIILTYSEIENGYFYDYNIPFEDTLPFPDSVTVKLSLAHLRADRDRDRIPDNIEQELLLSSHLPDSDLDGKTDDIDFSPLGTPLRHKENYEVYRAALIELMHLNDPENLNSSQDTAWTRYYGIYYTHEQTVAFVALPGETVMPELLNLPIITILARSPLYFTGRRLYTSSTRGIIPHLVFYKPKIDVLGSGASMDIEYVAGKYKRESATVHLSKTADKWVIDQVTVDE
ncbi:MAG: hypothetical protein ABIK83_07925 [Candidatus Zixiibacteriota bacterium]